MYRVKLMTDGYAVVNDDGAVIGDKHGIIHFFNYAAEAQELCDELNKKGE